MFDIETHDTLHQMTSLIEGRIKKGIGYKDIFKAIFPCGSVTGAPKKKTMEIIKQIEKGNRQIYCGAIGYISPDKAVFNVPIRTLYQPTSNKKDSSWIYRVGGGIVWDSIGEKEWEEIRTKTEFLHKNKPHGFSIVETMLLEKGEVKNEKEHFLRMKDSSIYFKFPFDKRAWKEKMYSIKAKASYSKKYVIRVLLNEKGDLSCERTPLERKGNKNIVKVSKITLDKKNVFLQHKTTYRPWYEKTMKKIKENKIWDEIFLNQEGQLCEGARSNVFVEKKGKLYTPCFESGLLRGTFRKKLLEEKKCKEKILALRDLKEADAVYCGNDVRGLVKVKVLFS
jgi:para-aminobenzoate synthetase/4-amino-4-deoxychorismate lyase